MDQPAVRAIQGNAIADSMDEALSLKSIEFAANWGFNYVRLPVAMTTISGATPAAARNWTRFDAMMGQAQARGLGVILNLTGNVYGKAGWNSHAEDYIMDSGDYADHVDLYHDIVDRALATHEGRLILQVGNEDAHYVFGANQKMPYTFGIDDASGTPIVVTTDAAHNIQIGDRVFVRGVAGTSEANGIWTVSDRTSTTIELDGSATGGTYGSTGADLVYQQALVPDWRHEFYELCSPILPPRFPGYPEAFRNTTCPTFRKRSPT